MQDEDNFDEEDSPKGKKKKRSKEDADPFKIYGDKFDGEFQRIGQVQHLIPPFKEFYFKAKRENFNTSVMKILKDFNDKIHPDRFFPYPQQYRRWRISWDNALYLELGMYEKGDVDSRTVKGLIKLRDEKRGEITPMDDDLEQGTNVLGGMLLNDAMHQLQNDQEIEEIYTSDELIKRKAYVLNVFSHITKKVQGKEGLRIKKQAEGRETAGFLMNLINRAVAGRVSEDDMTTLQSAIIDVEAKEPEQPNM